MLIGIAGPSASGKTTLAKKLSDYFNSKGTPCIILSLDDYYIEYNNLPKDVKVNFDQPEAIEFDLFREHISKLSRGESIPRIKYIHAYNKREYMEEEITPSSVIIVEGLFTLYDKDLCDKFDLKIFIEADLWQCLNRRLERAKIDPDRSEPTEQMVERYSQQVVKGYYDFIQPTKCNADLVLGGSIENLYLSLEKILKMSNIQNLIA